MGLSGIIIKKKKEPERQYYWTDLSGSPGAPKPHVFHEEGFSTRSCLKGSLPYMGRRDRQLVVFLLSFIICTVITQSFLILQGMYQNLHVALSCFSVRRGMPQIHSQGGDGDNVSGLLPLLS